MIAAAEQRNAHHVTAGVASFAVATAQEAVLDPDSFDRVLAMRVREMWTDAEAVLPRIRETLRPSGLVCLVIDAPRAGGTASAVAAARRALDRHGFAVEVREAPTGDLAAVLARP